ncbi:MAG: hypothetical protein LBP19_03240 [Treponema sp.]|jgi:hypothetical protein|nr:hypothetical protein [Treponema sp.]
MKKLFITLSFILISLFAQTDEYAKFQGVWIGEIPDDELDELTMFIFEDDSFFSLIDGIHTGKYVIEGNNVILKFGWAFWESYQGGWKREKEGEIVIQYIFSGDKLIFVFDGEPISYLKGIKDLPKRW